MIATWRSTILIALVRIRQPRVDLDVHLVVRLARARRASGRVHVAEIHLVLLGVGIARVGPLVVRVRPPRRIGIRRGLVEGLMWVRLAGGLLVGHSCSLDRVPWTVALRAPRPPPS